MIVDTFKKYKLNVKEYEALKIVKELITSFDAAGLEQCFQVDLDTVYQGIEDIIDKDEIDLEIFWCREC